MAADRTPLDLPGPLLLVGCGKMGGALLRGWLARGVAPASLFVADPEPRGLGGGEARGVTLLPEAAALPAAVTPALVLLAVKPQAMDAALPPLRRFVRPGTTFLTIAAGKTTAFLRRRLGEEAEIVRAMPNLPAAIGAGMTVLYRDPALAPERLALCRALLAAVGEVAFVDQEELLDPVTALSGGGPAYFFLLIEALAAAGAASGLPPDLALRLSRATLCGAGALAAGSPESAAALRAAVSSPGGTTLEALKVLMGEDGWQKPLDRAIAAATRRARALAE